jgi:hypothetical protein
MAYPGRGVDAIMYMLDYGWAGEVMPEKARSRPIVMSKAGRDLLAEAMPAWRTAQAKARQLLGNKALQP